MEALPKDLLDLEIQLRTFVPQAPQTSREQLLYQAGWEAALAQHNVPAAINPAERIQKVRQPAANYYWAAACAALLLLSTTLGWQVWHPPQPGVALPVVTRMPTAPSEKPVPVPAATLANSEPPNAPVVLPFAEPPTSGIASYLELRERVTRGGLSMWPVSMPVRTEAGDATQTRARDWQADLLREAL